MHRYLGIIFFLFTFHTDKLYGQDSIMNAYVVLTFEMDRNKDTHGTFIYYWIAEVDSISQASGLQLKPFFLHEFYTSDQLETCCSGKPSLMFAYTTESKFEYKDGYLEDLESLRKLVKQNRRIIQKIKKSWSNNYKEEVRVYATPINGNLCACEMIDDWSNSYEGNVFLANDGFKINNAFWSKEMKMLIREDFSNFDFVNSDYRTNR